MIDYQDLIIEYDLKWCNKVQYLACKRAELFTQEDMAKFTNKSLRTIQKFENYKCKDHFIMFVYETLIN